MAQSNNTLRTQILLRSDTTANWSKLDVDYKGGNAVLGKAEIGVELTGSIPKIKIGDGVTAWKDLPYFGGDIQEALTHQLDELRGTVETIEGTFDQYYNKNDIDSITTELESRISSIPKFTIEVVEGNAEGIPNVVDPSTTTIYIVPNNDASNSDVYTEWIYVVTEGTGTWELLGKQTLDLSNYATITYVNSKVEEVSDGLATLTTNYEALATVVGNETSGLVKDVADLKGIDIAGLIATAKQEAIDAAAAAVPVKTVNELEFTLTNGALAIKEIAQDKVAGLPIALSDRYTKTETDEAIQVAVAGIYENVYNKTETLAKIAEKITEVNGGQSAGEVLSQLNSYKEINDARVTAIEEDVVKINESIEGINTNIDALTTATIDVSRLTQEEDSYMILDGGDSTSFI